MSTAIETAVPHVSSNSKVMGGTLVFRGTRVPAQSLLDYLNDGYNLEQFLEFFPSVNKLDAEQFLLTVGRQVS